MNYFAFLPIVLGFGALLGWLVDSHALESSFVSLTVMNPLTACFMMLTGFALICFTPSSRKYSLLGLGWIAIIVVFCGSLTRLSDIIFDTSFNFDTLLFPGKLVLSGDHPNRMAPNAAGCFFMLSTATMIEALNPWLKKKTRQTFVVGLSQAIALATGFMALLALIGYAYQTDTFYSIGAFTPMALNTTICIFLLCFALLRLCPHGGLIKYIANAGPGGRMARLLIPASILVPLVMGWARLLGMRKGFYDAEFGVSVSVVFNILTSVIVTWVGAWMLYDTDCRRRESEKLLRYQATHDSLTGLSNRAVFTEHLQRRLNLAQRKPYIPFAVFYMDLDGFKQVNDQLGHAIGDKLLQDAADVLRRSTRTSDTAARFGGDEFTVLFEEVSSGDDVIVLAQRILESMPRDVTIDNKSVTIGVSIGIAVYAPHHKIADDILRDADLALYRAKSNGKGRYELAQAA